MRDASTKAGARVPRSGRLLAGHWILFALALAMSIACLYALPAFAPVLSAFGTDLPALTRWVMQVPAAVLIAPLAVMAAALRYTARNAVPAGQVRRQRAVFVALALAVVLFFALVVVAVYLPIFNLSAVA